MRLNNLIFILFVLFTNYCFGQANTLIITGVNMNVRVNYPDGSTKLFTYSKNQPVVGGQLVYYASGSFTTDDIPFRSSVENYRPNIEMSGFGGFNVFGSSGPKDQSYIGYTNYEGM